MQLLIVALLSALALWVMKRQRARAAAAAELRAKREAVWLRRVAHQKRVRERLLSINDESLALLESMPGWVEAAEKHLDQAEIDFTEGAFAPFWSSVERAALSLAAFDESVQKLESHSSEYGDLAAQCRSHVPPFAVSPCAMTRMTVATATAHRMHGIVRRAQRDFHFSVIYEHRKTNQILVAGFRGLAQAVEEMASRITASIETLTNSVDKMAASLDESLRRLTGHAETLVATGKAGREEQILEVLERIEQRRYHSAIQGV